ncbi:hypothetical protein Pse7367_1534 [Thalassoporum mexicanum PCC 7367]|nr:hypothetical protein Pse7367_1534 [Pseudanabaena sp. PCC 7367]
MPEKQVYNNVDSINVNYSIQFSSIYGSYMFLFQVLGAQISLI